MPKDPLYVTWDNESQKQQAYQSTASNLDAYTGVQRSVAYGPGRQTYLDIETQRSVRPEFTRTDYNLFRPQEAVPHFQQQIIRQCMAAYDNVGIIRNVIDLMSDFACQGLTLVHPNKVVEKFYRKWFSQVGGQERTERFLNYLYRCGNVVVRRRTAKLSKEKESEIMKAAAADITLELKKYNKREIPWRYDFLNPIAVEADDPGMNALGMPKFSLNLSKYTLSSITKTVESNSSILSTLPEDLKQLIERGERRLPLDPGSTLFFHYKKDDWLLWANPMIYAILDDIKMLEKMKLADLAALDGAISNVRLWTVGDLDHKIIPTKAAIDKLRDILASNVGGGTMDLVWGPELKFTESQSQVYRFLGAEKYSPVLSSIYAGLGIPPTLTGMSASGGYTNNYISLKTLVERLQYGRDIVSRFWKQEIEIVRKAMGFRLPADIHFDHIIISDESTEKQLLIQLADRDLISTETLLERFGELPMIEKTRVRREDKDRKNEVIPDKASPYHNPNHKNDMEKIDEQGKINMKLKREDIKNKPAAPQASNPGEVRQAGRPLNRGDTQKRKQREVKPRSSEASAILWGMEAQAKIAEILNPVILNHFDKTDVRSLTKEETNQLDYLKNVVFANLAVYSDVNEGLVKEVLDSKKGLSKAYLQNVDDGIKDFQSKHNRRPNTNEMKLIRSYALAVDLKKDEDLTS